MMSESQQGDANAENVAKHKYRNVKAPWRRGATVMDLLINAFGLLALISGGVLAVVGIFTHWKNKETIAIWAFYFTIIFAVTAFFFSWQKRISERMAKEQNAAATLTNPQHPDRAYVLVKGANLADPPSTGKYPVATVVFENTGNTPAVNMKTHVSSALIKGEVRERARQGIMPELKGASYISTAVLGRGGRSKIITPKFDWKSQEQRKLTIEGEFVLYVWGKVYYDDAFGGKHISHFCMSAEDPSSRSLGYCPHGNSIEDVAEDSQASPDQ